MQTYLPIIEAMLSEWYLFTLNNALYATALAIAVWLLATILYSIKIAALKRGKIASEKVGIENLAVVQQQLQHSQGELTTTVDQMEKANRVAQDETQRALALEQLIYQRNQQIAGIIQILATSFDLGERPLLATEDVKAESLWQQHDKVITQLIERLRTELKSKIELQQSYQANATKLAEKDALLEALQTSLANQSNQLSKIEQALEEQKTMLQQQDHAQQGFSDALKKYQPDLSQPAEPEQNTVNTPNTWQQPIQPEDTQVTQSVQDHQIAQTIEESQTAVTRQIEEAPIVQLTTDEAVAPVPSEMGSQPVVEEAPSLSLNIEQEPANPAKGSFGKIKKLFGKTKQQPIKTEPQWAAEKLEEKEAQPLPSNEEQQPNAATESEKKPGKLKGFYSKFRSKNK